MGDTIQPIIISKQEKHYFIDEQTVDQSWELSDGKDFRATANICSINVSTGTRQGKAVLTGMGQLLSIFQVHVGFFSPGLRKYRKLMEWKLKLLLCLQGIPLEALVPHIWSFI